MTDLKELIIDQLKEVYDPEIPINVYDLGLIYEINVKEDNNVHVVMSLTSPTCPTADYLKMMIEEATAGTPGVNEVEVELTFEPKWTPDRVSQEAKEELGLSSAAPTENLAVQGVFQGDQTSLGKKDNSGIHEGALNENSSIKENICFNCSATQEVRPIIECHYKGERTAVCSQCLGKF